MPEIQAQEHRIDPIAAAREHYQRTVANYLAATTPEQRRARSAAMEQALRQTLEMRHRS